MYLSELGHSIRVRRKARGWTQAALARKVGLGRTTLNQLENGVFPDIGVKKVMAILQTLDQDLAVVPKTRKAGPDFLKMAATSASVSYKDILAPDELARILLSGKVPPKLRPHLRVVLEEVPPSVLDGALKQLAAWTKPEKLRKNLVAIAKQVGSVAKVTLWQTTE
jgi:transcriptional regulator with XRE-family HTH domain